MVKQQHQVKAAKQGNLQKFEQHVVFDDSLPDAEQIERLIKHDPNILNWLKSQAEKEQQFRHSMQFDRMKIADKHNSKDHNTIRFGTILYGLLVIGFGVASFFLIIKGFNLQGTIFGGTTVFLALALIVGRGRMKPPSN